MTSMKYLKIFSILLLLLCTTRAFALSIPIDCNHITTEKQQAECSFNGQSKNFIMEPMERMWMHGPVGWMSNLLANVLFFKSDNVDRFQVQEYKQSSLTDLTDKIPQTISIIFVIVSLFNFIKIINTLRKTGGGDERNNGFLILNLVFAFLGQGLNGKYYMLCAIMFVGMYGATFTAMQIAPIFIDASVHDEAAVKSRGMRKVNVFVPPFYSSMIKAHLDDLTVRKPMFFHYSTEQDLNTGKFKIVDSVTVTDKDNRAYTYKNFATCLAKSVGEPYFKGQLLVDPEQKKTAECAKATGIKDFETASFYYSGEREEIKNIILDADKSAREVAQMVVELTCSSNLNKHDNRVKYSDNGLVYQQCLDLSAKGVPRIADGVVTLVDSSVTSAALVDRITRDAERFADAFSPVVDDMIAVQKATVDSKVGYSSDITSLLYVITRAYSKGDVNSELQNEFDKMHFAQNGGSSLSPASAAMIGLDADDLSSASQSIKDETRGQPRAVQKLVDFDRTYQNLVAQKLSATMSLKQTTGIVANFLTNDFFEVTGYTSDDCMSNKRTCIVAALNQAAAQHAAAMQAIKDSTYVYTGFSMVRLKYDIQRAMAKKDRLYPVITEADIALKRIDMALSWTKNAITFFVVTMLIKDNVFVFVVVSNLLFWLYGFWSTLIVMTRNGMRNISPTDDEVGKSSRNIEAFKQMFWLLIAPSLYVAFFFINQGLYSYSLTIQGSAVASMSKLITFGGSGLIQQFVAQILLYIIHTAIATALPFAIIKQTNKIPRKLEKMFNVAHNEDGDNKAMESAQHVEHKLEYAIKNAV